MNIINIIDDKKEKINSIEGHGSIEIGNPGGRILAEIDVWGETSEEEVIRVFADLLVELKEAIEEPFIIKGSSKRVEVKINLNHEQN